MAEATQNRGHQMKVDWDPMLDMPNEEHLLQLHNSLLQSTLKSISMEEANFEDRLHHFVEILKKLTHVQEVNIFSKEHVQIYKDHHSQGELKCTA